MKKTFYLGLAGLLLYEFLRVYFIMPLPGSQEMNSISIAYWLHQFRWCARFVFISMVIRGSIYTFPHSRWKIIPAASVLIVAAALYLFNFPMSADHMFLQPAVIKYLSPNDSALNKDAQVIGVTINGESKAYPVSYILYHHQVRDRIGGTPVMVTYCSVCRSGRVYMPLVNEKSETFRLVGMDHWNAMFEDETTGSWWRQVNGEAIAGELKGQHLPEVPCVQMTVASWLKLHPDGKVLAGDPHLADNYDTELKFENGKNNSALTGTDTSSWKNKSWIIGIAVNDESKAYDWNELKSNKVINDVIGRVPVAIVLYDDGKSFAAFRKDDASPLLVVNDTLIYNNRRYNPAGISCSGSSPLQPVTAYQEFWHSWKTFHPRTRQYQVARL
jgi:hypothetical protein